ncbi:uncharacterized protein LOC100902447 [Galendromus occidentalis]|uniref:Uncharacterized protein LOC100902447 n=1 Tax=Galendromus occidentalis TaxID=34638 RepID=A0AAJ6QSD0_9ACAR|nr:uncharacterized protein LOC100902447 [Galendromus occidentalis]
MSILQGASCPAKCKAELSIELKNKKLARAGFCSKCLRSGHLEDKCSSQIQCIKCKGDHHGSLCPNVRSAVVAQSNQAETLAAVGHLMLLGPDGSQRVRFLLDSGANTTFITEEYAELLNLEVVGSDKFLLHRFGEQVSQSSECRIVRFGVLTSDNRALQFTALVVPEISNLEPKPLSGEIRARLQNPSDHPKGPRKLGILFSFSDMVQIIKGGFKKLTESVSYLDTIFGQVPVSENKPASDSGAAFPVNIEKFWELEHIGILPEEHTVDGKISETFIQDFLKTVEFKDGMYSTILNLDSRKLEYLTDNFPAAKQQAHKLLKSLDQKPSLREEYIKQMNVFFDSGYAEPVPLGEKPRYFMPHFPVVNESKVSYKVRPVFNASSKMKGQLSLNDVILEVPNLLPTSVEMLSKFRVREIAFVGDITKAYLTIGVKPEMRNFQCFLWSRNGDASNLKVYRMNRNCFGVKDAQFNVISVIRMHANNFQNSHPGASKALMEDLYMDDLVTGADSIEEAREIQSDISYILGKAAMVMRKWRFSEESCDDNSQVILGSQMPEKVLGVVWNNETDALTFDPANLIEFVAAAKPTKRTLLGAAARLYDPTGFLSPFVMQIKLLIQKVHLQKLGLDKAFQGEILDGWKKWCDQLPFISRFQIPRCFTKGFRAVKLELHTFADASDSAYAAVVYLKSWNPNSDERAVVLVASKARMTPLKSLSSLTIPKKELVAAMCAARLAASIKKFLNLSCETFYWTDSMNVYYWIRRDCPLKYEVFVRNRLIEISKLTKPLEWRHVPGVENPADYPSRGMSMEKLLKEPSWLNGPAFLKSEIYPEVHSTEVEVFVATATQVEVKEKNSVIPIERYSTLRRAIRVTATIFRAIAIFQLRWYQKNARTRKSKELASQKVKLFGKGVPSDSITRRPITALELKLAKQHLTREAQQRCFREVALSRSVAESQALTSLGAYFDSADLLRLGGRLENFEGDEALKHPIVLSEDWFTTLVIRDLHENQLSHLRTDMVLANLRQEFWILQARRQVKKVIGRCVRCKRYTAKPSGAPQAPLPAPRTESGGVFRNVGIDYLGPFEIRSGKVWICLFTCSVTRGVHFEVVEDYSAEAFLQALKRFVATRGLPARIISDNGSNFVRSARGLRCLWENLRSAQVQEFMSVRGFQWSFNVPRAAWWGGQFERLVRVTKDCMRKTLNGAVLSLFGFMTAIKEIEAIINSRPLTVLPDNPSLPEALTPAHFITGANSLSLPKGSVKSKGEKDDRLTRFWRIREKLLNDFWMRWRNEYFLMLRSAHEKGRVRDSSPLALDDIVLIHEPKLERARWRLGRVVELPPGKDKVVRSCRVKTQNGILTRALQHIYRLI